VTQGVPLSSLIFNVVVNAVVREWLRRTLDDEAARDGLTMAQSATPIVSFYVDDGVLSARDPVWLQSALNILITLFEQVGLETNTKKTQVMTCIPSKIRESLSKEVYHDRKLGLLSSTDRKRLCVECDICGERLQASSLQSHLEMQHDVYRSFVLNWELTEVMPTTFCAQLHTASGEYDCPVPGCVGTANDMGYNLRRHFVMRHPTHTVIIPKEGSLPLPRCHLCGMQTPAESLSKGHTQTELCWDLCAWKRQHALTRDSWLALEMQFTTYGKELEQVLVFKYLGRLLACDDNDTQAMRGNLAKARKCWAWISCVLRAENAEPQVCVVFYKATVMSVPLFGSETWSLAPGTLKRLDGFHHRAAWRMAGMHPLHDSEGNWTYPSNTRVLKKGGLYTIEHYIGVRRQTISNYFVN
jgi:hypothetical protein